jgi:hypothetical protein
MLEYVRQFLALSRRLVEAATFGIILEIPPWDRHNLQSKVMVVHIITKK